MKRAPAGRGLGLAGRCRVPGMTRVNSSPRVRPLITGATGGGPAGGSAGEDRRASASCPTSASGQATAMARPTTRSRDTKAFSPFDRARLHIIEVAARVATLVAIVPHHENPVGRHGHVEADLRRLDLLAVGTAVQVAGLVERLAR